MDNVFDLMSMAQSIVDDDNMNSNINDMMQVNTVGDDFSKVVEHKKSTKRKRRTKHTNHKNSTKHAEERRLKKEIAQTLSDAEPPYALGALDSPIEVMAQSHVYTADINFPNEVDLRTKLQDVKNQGRQGTCVAQVGACIIEYFARKSRSLSIEFSPQFIYNNRQNKGSGMHPSNCANIMKMLGCAYEHSYPYGKIEPAADIAQSVLDQAIQWRCKNAYRIHSMDALKSAIYNNGPCLITFTVYNYTNEFWVKQRKDKFIGNHAVAVVGYNNTGFIIRNSWGTNWGSNGYTHYPYHQWGHHKELWTYIDSPKIHPNDKTAQCISGIPCCVL